MAMYLNFLFKRSVVGYKGLVLGGEMEMVKHFPFSFVRHGKGKHSFVMILAPSFSLFNPSSNFFV